MNWCIFEYAGHTALAWMSLVLSVFVAFSLAGACVWCIVRRRTFIRIAMPAVLLVAYVATWLWAGPALDHAWLYLQENASRKYSTYVALTAATAFLPPLGDTGRKAFIHLATRDTGFAKGRPVSTVRIDGTEISTFQDQDYPGGVTTLDGRPVDTGYRFRATRRLPALIALAEMPGARTVRVLGRDAPFATNVFSQAGLKVLGPDGQAPADIIFTVPGPDWMVGADTPDASTWKRLASTLSNGGVAALRLDGRLMSRTRLKGILADFRAAFSHYRLWCVGRYDYVATAGGKVLADELLDLFAKPEAFAVFASADIYTPAELFACYMGTDYEIEPGLLEIPAASHASAIWNAPKLAFSDAPTNHLAAIRPATLTPYYIPPVDWFLRGTAAPTIWSSLTNQIMAAQGARREILLGFDAADRGASTNALEHWSSAAKVNPRDPLLGNLADSLDLEGRRFLRLGNVNGAMRCYENRLLIRPTDVAAVHNFGVCLKKSGHWALAARVFAKAVTMDPLTDEHRYEMVETCAASGFEDIAARQLEVLMKRHPDEPALKLRTARLLASPSCKIRNETRAIELAEEAVRLTGWKDRAFVQGLADVYIAAGRAVMGMGLKKKMREMRFER